MRLHKTILLFGVMVMLGGFSHFEVCAGESVATEGDGTQITQPTTPEEGQAAEATLQLSKSKITLYTGKDKNKGKITANVTGPSKQVRWISGDDTIAKVNSTGQITAVGEGSTLVFATANGITRSVIVKVANPKFYVKQGSKNVSTVSVYEKKQTTLKVTTNPSKAGFKMAKQNKKSKAVAEVKLKNGKLYITGKSVGTTKIQLSSGGAIKYVTIQVKAPKLQKTKYILGDSNPYYIKVNRQANCVTIYGRDGKGNHTVPVRAMVCSVGKNGGTPVGVFKTSNKYDWRPLYGNVYGQYAFRINGPILFHSVPYIAPDKGTLEYDEYNKLGKAASLGCVRLSVSDAKWIYDNCPSGTMVEIYDSRNPGPLGKPKSVHIDPKSPYRSWDPTDPDLGNPWRHIRPTIHVAKKIVVERGEKINYLEYASATNFLGEAIKVSKSGTVKINKCGTYTVTYTARDGFGNKTKKKVKFVVKDTTKPVLTVTNHVEINDGCLEELDRRILGAVSARDGKDVLPKNRVVLDTKTVREAISQKRYGTYICTAYVSDLAKNKSNRVKIVVIYGN